MIEPTPETKVAPASLLGVDRVQADVYPSRRARNDQPHILLVEDNEDDRDYLADAICNASPNYTVTAVATGQDACAVLARDGADCVILDFRLEAEDGIDILPQLKMIAPFVPVIMMSGQGSEAVAAQSIKAGASDYLIKGAMTGPTLLTSIDMAISRAMLETIIADQDAEREQLLNIMVHDLRAPLRQLRVISALVAEQIGSGSPPDVDHLLQSQMAIAERANALIADLQSYALLHNEMAFAPVSLTEAAHAARENLTEDLAASRAMLTISDLPTVDGNHSRLVRLFQNLISNGLKFNHNPQPTISIDVFERTTDSVVIAVRDNGIGIAEDHLEQIFLPLKRLWTTADYDGTGLGLSICARTMLRHGGRIWCQSSPGEGTTFCMKFPT